MSENKKMEVLSITIDKQHQKIKVLEKNVFDLQ